MSGLSRLLFVAVLASAPAAELVVQPGETLPAAAARVGLHDVPEEELRALNALPASGPVAAGTTLKLPGRERAVAQSALETARSALAQPLKKGTASPDAKLALEEAEAHFKAARYAEAGQAADRAWSLVSTSSPSDGGTSFAVEVTESGQTKVQTQSGRPVRVEASGVSKNVKAGQFVHVRPGKPPEEPRPPPSPPKLSQPADGSQLRLKPTPQGLGPVRLRWSQVSGAKRYEVQVSRPDGTPVQELQVATVEATLPRLDAGSYRWTVRVVDASGERSEPSDMWGFEIQAQPVKLEVKGGQWK